MVATFRRRITKPWKIPNLICRRTQLIQQTFTIRNFTTIITNTKNMDFSDKEKLCWLTFLKIVLLLDNPKVLW